MKEIALKSPGFIRLSVAAILSCFPILLGAVVGRYTTKDNDSHREECSYEKLDRPVYTPPSMVFSVVWTLLYIFLGVSVFISYAWGGAPFGVVYGAMFLNLFFNLTFPVVQFRAKNVLWAAIMAWATLVTSILLTVVVYVHSGSSLKSPTVLLLPYVAWLVFAAVLSTDIYIRNSIQCA